MGEMAQFSCKALVERIKPWRRQEKRASPSVMKKEKSKL